LFVGLSRLRHEEVEVRMKGSLGLVSVETFAPSGIPITGDEECLKVTDQYPEVATESTLTLFKFENVFSFYRAISQSKVLVFITSAVF
jgi:hypothetical protein